MRSFILRRVFIIYVLVLYLFYSNSYAQSSSDLNFLIQHRSNTISHTNEKNYHLSYETSEVKIFFINIIRFYQVFISSQQNRNVCVFTPSCSRFGLSAIKKYGPIYGILMASDRVQRCYGQTNKYYLIDSQTEKFYDPVEFYFLSFWGK